MYIVWTDNSTDGWSRSDDLATLAEVFEHIATTTYGNRYVITKTVEVELHEKKPTQYMFNNVHTSVDQVEQLAKLQALGGTGL